MQNISSAYWKLFNFVMTFKRSFEDETRRVEGKHLFCLKQFEFSKVLKGNIEIAFWKERNVYILVIWCFARGTFGEKKIPHRLPWNKQSRIQSSCVWYFWIQIILASHKFWAFSIFSKLDVLPLTEAFHMALFCIKTLLSKGQMILGSVYRLALVHPQPTCPAPVLQVQVQVPPVVHRLRCLTESLSTAVECSSIPFCILCWIFFALSIYLWNFHFSSGGFCAPSSVSSCSSKLVSRRRPVESGRNCSLQL